ncbi:hypothetical protein DPMN_116306 [Dreissena polymorpha]|uniref:Uncharacterized protein n=1 Tax=Dreissena polymorpha TaxID=45954 RepID=A0A9D4KP65_DREPO|nr:hypothetical protein DPMN_116306 [Dreissena polymorpha]
MRRAKESGLKQSTLEECCRCPMLHKELKGISKYSEIRSNMEVIWHVCDYMVITTVDETHW